LLLSCCRELERWGIGEHRPVSIWYLYEVYILAGTVSFLLQRGLVVGLLMSAAWKDPTQEEDREAVMRSGEPASTRVAAAFRSLHAARLDHKGFSARQRLQFSPVCIASVAVFTYVTALRAPSELTVEFS
jgi:hypothetical protein